MNKEFITINGNNLKIEEIYEVCYQKKPVRFPDNSEFINKLNESRSFFEAYMEKGYPIYGVTTGFGDSCNNQISPQKTELLQKSLVNFHGIGVGDFFSEEISRAVVLIRLNSNIKGYSAIRNELAQLMLAFINHQIIPAIPMIGSVGASGDLTPLSYLAAALMGERKVYYKGKIVNTNVALEFEKLKPIKLQAKEGLALMNGTSVMTAAASLAWYDVQKLASISDYITGATVEITQGNEIPFRHKVSLIKNHPGQIESSDCIYQVFKGSKRVNQYENLLNTIGTIENNDFKKHTIKIQDRYSIRCAPQISGVLRDTLTFTRQWIENEINSANDNPLIDPQEGFIYNSGNFYGGHIAGACDYLRIALANIADLSDKQSALIIDGKFNNLTENLIPILDENSPMKGLLHGFKAAQISISAISSEIQFLAAPVSIHSRVTESLNQDKVSLGTISARKLIEQVDLLFTQYAIHLLAVLQAIDLVGVNEFSLLTQKVYQELRQLTSFVQEDRPLDEETAQLKQYLKQSTLFLNLFKITG